MSRVEWYRNKRRESNTERCVLVLDSNEKIVSIFVAFLTFAAEMREYLAAEVVRNT